MNGKQIVLSLVLVTFLAESAYVLGITGLNWIAPVLASPIASLLLFDLTICLALIAVWMVRDARERGTAAWPYVALSVLLGGAGPLLYLIRRERSPARQPIDAVTA